MSDKKELPVEETERRTWEEFRESGLLWWVNRLLHTFGWAIVVVLEHHGKVSDVYPARVPFRGFSEKSEEAGFRRLSAWMGKAWRALKEEADA